MVIERVEVGPLLSNSYLIFDPVPREAVIIDAGDDAWKILGVVQKHRVRVRAVYATHCHFDHIMAVGELKEALGCGFYIHRDDLSLLESASKEARKLLGASYPDPPKPDGYVEEGDEVKVGDGALKVIHTPGHSPGSVCYVAEGAVFTGDTLFTGSIGRVDMPGGDLEKLKASIFEKLFKLPDDYAVYPGHGPSSTIGAEKLYNVYVGENGILRE